MWPGYSPPCAEVTPCLSGGGSLLQDTTSTRSLFYYLSVIRCAELLGKPVMLYANGIGPVHKPANRRRVKRVVERAALVTLRDHSSARELRDMGVTRDDIRVTADPVFHLAPAGEARCAQLLSGHRHSKRQAFCGGVRPWLARYGRVPQGAGPAVRPPAPGPWVWRCSFCSCSPIRTGRPPGR